MGYNKFIYHGEVKFDLTGDTVTAETLAKGVTAHDKAGELITGTSTKDADTSDATVAVGEILEGKTAYARGIKLTGTMPNNGAVELTISNKTDEITIAQGYHDGSGTAAISETEQAKIIGDNIRKGVSILGVVGTMEEDTENPETGKEVIPTVEDQTITPSADYTCFREIVVKAIPYAETPNAAGGLTITIA